MYGNEVSSSEALIITVFSMAVVFLVLLAISYMIDLLRIVLTKSGKKKAPAEVQPAAAPAAAAPAPSVSGDAAVLAAAAIAAYLGGSGDNFVVRKIIRLPDNESGWSLSGRVPIIR